MKRNLVLLMALGALSVASAQPQENGSRVFTRSEFMLPMRDGTQLFTVVMRPMAATGPLPFLMMRTPYGADSGAKALDRGPGFILDLA